MGIGPSAVLVGNHLVGIRPGVALLIWFTSWAWLLFSRGAAHAVEWSDACRHIHDTWRGTDRDTHRSA